MFVYYDSKRVMDLDTDKLVPFPEVHGGDILYSNPPVLNYMQNGACFQLTESCIGFLKHIKSMEWVKKAGGVVYKESIFRGGQYIINGIIGNHTVGYMTMYEALRDADLSSGEIYIPHRDVGYVHIEFKDDISLFLVKDAVLRRKRNANLL